MILRMGWPCKARRAMQLIEEGQAQEAADDPDVIIPDRIARPLLVSSNLMLITAMVAAAQSVWPLCASAAAVWVTSLLHWYAPRFSSFRRYLDYAAVASMVMVGGWIAVNHSRSFAWMLTYFVGLALIGVIFTVNETLYYFQLQRTPAGGHMTAGRDKLTGMLACLAPTQPGTAEQLWAYQRAMWVHLLCVHVLAAALANILLLFGLRPADSV